MGCNASKSVQPWNGPAPEATRLARLQRWDTSDPSQWRGSSEQLQPGSTRDTQNQTSWDLVRQELHDARRPHSPATLRMQQAHQAESALKTMDAWQHAAAKARSMSMPELRWASPGRARSLGGDPARSTETARSTARAVLFALFELRADRPQPRDAKEQLGARAKAEDVFEGQELARYLVSRLSFTHPVSKRPLTIEECRRLDAHLIERGLETLAIVTNSYGDRAFAA